MKFMEVRNNYLYVYYDEQNEYDALVALMHEVAETAKRAKVHRLLADLRQMKGEPNFMVRYRLGLAAVWILRGIHKSAILYKKHETNYIAETVAHNRGLRTLITDDAEEAERWIEVD